MAFTRILLMCTPTRRGTRAEIIRPGVWLSVDWFFMIGRLLEKLDVEDDPDLWRVVLVKILSDVQPMRGLTVEVGRCSHWLRPHQTRWTADGGFAAPLGYGKGRCVPEFDWSVVFEWSGEEWNVASDQSVKPSFQVVVPARTTRHNQAAVFTHWKSGKKEKHIPYGFRKKRNGWQLTAVGNESEKRKNGRAEDRAKTLKLQRR